MKRIYQLAIVVLMVVSTGVLGIAGSASAKNKHHHQSGKGGPSAPMTIQIDPNPFVETSQSEFEAVIQVETSPAFSGDLVQITSSQLQAACGGVFGSETAVYQSFGFPPPMALDNEGNATAILVGQDCAPGTDLIEADLLSAPFYTAVGTFVLKPPSVTTPGIFAFPTSSGTVSGGEVETGDTQSSGESSIFAVFQIEADPVYAEQSATIDFSQLATRCPNAIAVLLLQNGFSLVRITPTPPGPILAANQIDNDGNATIGFFGSSCAAGPALVTAEVDAGTHPTYTTTFNILPPQPTI